MPELASTAVTRIYENTNVTVKAKIDKRDVDSIQEVAFKFLKDGEQFLEKTIPISEGKRSGDDVIVSHLVQAPAVPEDKDRYFLDYYYFYKVKSATSTESLQNFPSSRIQVFPRFAQLKVTDKDGKAFPNFEFMVEQDGQPSPVRKTLVGDTPNAKGETIPAGSCEFELKPSPNFRIVPAPPFEIVEEVVGTGRKREVKGTIGFRAMFVAPQKGNIKQYVNYDPENLGQTGVGHEVVIEVGVDPEDVDKIGDKNAAEVYFRVTFGPDDTDPAPKSKRDDADHPTKVLKVSESDTTTTIEEKEAGKKYQGKVTLKGGKFKVALGKAGGDTCKVEISGSDKLLTDAARSPDATLQFQNWRRVYFEVMFPDIMQDRVFQPLLQSLEKLGRPLFIEFLQDAAHVFMAEREAGDGTLAPGRFLGRTPPQYGPVYILAARNWRTLPGQQTWREEHPNQTLFVIACDAFLKWRKGTDEPQKGTVDFSGTLKEATGFINVEEKFGGVFMPASGDDGEEGISEFHWLADISKDDSVCKYTPELEIKEVRTSGWLGEGLEVEVTAGRQFPPMSGPIAFTRLQYPILELHDLTTELAKGETDDHKVTLKEPALKKELTLEFASGPVVTADHHDQIAAFFKKLFSDGRDTLSANEDANRFNIEAHGKRGSAQLVGDVLGETIKAYQQTFEHDQHVFKGKLTGAQAGAIESFVGNLLADPYALHDVNAKVVVTINGPKDTKHGEDECFNAVKNKLKDSFDARKAAFSYHPGLTRDGKPREGSCSLGEITVWPSPYGDEPASTLREWHYLLPVAQLDGLPAPGSFVGAEKTAEKCAVKVDFSVKPHEESKGEVEGKLLLWVCDPATAGKQLTRLCLQAFAAREDSASVEHGHAGDGKPGDCLEEEEALCDKCIDFGRSRDLTVIG